MVDSDTSLPPVNGQWAGIYRFHWDTYNPSRYDGVIAGEAYAPFSRLTRVLNGHARPWYDITTKDVTFTQTTSFQDGNGINYRSSGFNSLNAQDFAGGNGHRYWHFATTSNNQTAGQGSYNVINYTPGPNSGRPPITGSNDPYAIPFIVNQSFTPYDIVGLHRSDWDDIDVQTNYFTGSTMQRSDSGHFVVSYEVPKLHQQTTSHITVDFSHADRYKWFDPHIGHNEMFTNINEISSPVGCGNLRTLLSDKYTLGSRRLNFGSWNYLNMVANGAADVVGDEKSTYKFWSRVTLSFSATNYQLNEVGTIDPTVSGHYSNCCSMDEQTTGGAATTAYLECFSEYGSPLTQFKIGGNASTLKIVSPWGGHTYSGNFSTGFDDGPKTNAQGYEYFDSSGGGQSVNVTTNLLDTLRSSGRSNCINSIFDITDDLDGTSGQAELEWTTQNEGRIQTESFWVYSYASQLRQKSTLQGVENYAPTFMFKCDGGGGGGTARSGVGVTASTYAHNPRIKMWGQQVINGDITSGGSSTQNLVYDDGTVLSLGCNFGTGSSNSEFLSSTLTPEQPGAFICTQDNTAGTFTFVPTVSHSGSYDCCLAIPFGETRNNRPCYDHFSYWDAPWRPRWNVIDPGTGANSDYYPRAGDKIRITVLAEQCAWPGSGVPTPGGSGATMQLSRIGYIDKDDSTSISFATPTANNPQWTPDGTEFTFELDMFADVAGGTAPFDHTLWGNIGAFEFTYSGSPTNGIAIRELSAEIIFDAYLDGTIVGGGSLTRTSNPIVSVLQFHDKRIDTNAIVNNPDTVPYLNNPTSTYTLNSTVQFPINEYSAETVSATSTTAYLPFDTGSAESEFYYCILNAEGSLDDGNLAAPSVPGAASVFSSVIGNTGIDPAEREFENRILLLWGTRDPRTPIAAPEVNLGIDCQYLTHFSMDNYFNAVTLNEFTEWYDLMISENMIHPDLVDDLEYKILLSNIFNKAYNTWGETHVAVMGGLITPFGNRIMNTHYNAAANLLKRNWTGNLDTRALDGAEQHKKDDGNFYSAEFEWGVGPLGYVGNRYGQRHALPDGSDAATVATNLQTDMFLEMGRNPNAGEDPNQGNQYWLNNFYVPDGKYSIGKDRSSVYEADNSDFSIIYGLKGNPGTKSYVQLRPKGPLNLAPYFNSWDAYQKDAPDSNIPVWNIHGRKIPYKHFYGVDGILPQWEQNLGSPFAYFRSMYMTESGASHYSRGGDGRTLWNDQEINRGNNRWQNRYEQADADGEYLFTKWLESDESRGEAFMGRERSHFAYSPGIWATMKFGTSVGNDSLDYQKKGMFQGRWSNSYNLRGGVRFDLGVDTITPDPTGAHQMPWDAAYLTQRNATWYSGTGKHSPVTYNFTNRESKFGRAVQYIFAFIPGQYTNNLTGKDRGSSYYKWSTGGHYLTESVLPSTQLNYEPNPSQLLSWGFGKGLGTSITDYPQNYRGTEVWGRESNIDADNVLVNRQKSHYQSANIHKYLPWHVRKNQPVYVSNHRFVDYETWADNEQIKRFSDRSLSDVNHTDWSTGVNSDFVFGENNYNQWLTTGYWDANFGANSTITQEANDGWFDMSSGLVCGFVTSYLGPNLGVHITGEGSYPLQRAIFELDSFDNNVTFPATNVVNYPNITVPEWNDVAWIQFDHGNQDTNGDDTCNGNDGPNSGSPQQVTSVSNGSITVAGSPWTVANTPLTGTKIQSYLDIEVGENLSGSYGLQPFCGVTTANGGVWTPSSYFGWDTYQPHYFHTYKQPTLGFGFTGEYSTLNQSVNIYGGLTQNLSLHTAEIDVVVGGDHMYRALAGGQQAGRRAWPFSDWAWLFPYGYSKNTYMYSQPTVGRRFLGWQQHKNYLGLESQEEEALPFGSGYVRLRHIREFMLSFEDGKTTWTYSKTDNPHPDDSDYDDPKNLLRSGRGSQFDVYYWEMKYQSIKLGHGNNYRRGQDAGWYSASKDMAKFRDDCNAGLGHVTDSGAELHYALNEDGQVDVPDLTNVANPTPTNVHPNTRTSDFDPGLSDGTKRFRRGIRRGFYNEGRDTSYNAFLKAGRDEVYAPHYSSARIFAMDSGQNNRELYSNQVEGYNTGEWIVDDLHDAYDDLLEYLIQKFADYDPIQD